jgi:aspartate/tyrosine/aromatic aminotransferase
MTPILDCVKQAERRLIESESSKSYLAIDGNPDYARHVSALLFSDQIDAARLATMQTPGGTGALRVAGDFIKQMFPSSRIWCSRPTWVNHPHVFAAAGLEVQEYAYFDAETNSLDFDAMLSDLRRVPAGDVVLLHGCCHNPTGVDPTPEQWEVLGKTLAARQALPLVDIAYQGLSAGLEEDAAGLRSLLDAHEELLVCSSFSKNFGLYRERVGALVVLGKTGDAAQTVLTQLKRLVRSNYSSPPSHGAAIVTTVLDDAELTSCWRRELAEMRERINGMRKLFVERLKAAGIDRDFSYIQRQRGMFSFSGLNREHVDRLRDEFSIYIVGSGRINVAGITEDNVDRLSQAIATVL